MYESAVNEDVEKFVEDEEIDKLGRNERMGQSWWERYQGGVLMPRSFQGEGGKKIPARDYKRKRATANGLQRRLSD